MQSRRTLGNLAYSGWDVFWIALDRAASTARSRLSLRLQGCSYGRGFATTGHCTFKARNAGAIRIGNDVRLLAGWRSNRVGLTNPVLLFTFGEGLIEIGDNTGGSGVVVSSRSSIKIGEHVNLGGNTRIFDHDFHSLDPIHRRTGQLDQANVQTREVTIGDDVLLGAGAYILKGVTLGSGCIVGAGAVVTAGSYPSRSLIAGNPARLVRTLPPVQELF